MSFPLQADRDTLLSPIDGDDAAPVFEETDRSRRYLRRWLPWLDGVRATEDTSRFIRAATRRRIESTGLTLTILHRGEMAGIIDLHHIDASNRSASIGYWLGFRFQGKGLMLRSVACLMDYAFASMSLNRLELRVAPGNQRSRAIPRKLGFRLEGTLIEAEWLYDHYVDHELYAITHREWRRRRDGAPDSAPDEFAFRQDSVDRSRVVARKVPN